jgi:4-hydroxy-3-polyprenylbenzoate decarboxylase
LPAALPTALRLPEAFADPRIVLPGVLAVRGPTHRGSGVGGRDAAVESFCAAYATEDPINRLPLVVIVDDSDFAARTLNNFLWVTFTRSNPAADVHGVGAFTRDKHWGCTGPLVIDARIKPHHAPPLVEDPEVTKRIDALAARGGPLAKFL